MSRSAKILLVLAAVFVVLGLVIFSAAMIATNWDFTKLNTVNYETNRHEISEQFSDISVTTETADVVFLPSQDGKCTVVSYEAENARHTVSVQNGTLNIKLADTRRWYEHITFFSIGSPKITVYLPETEYASLEVRTDTGDVNIPKDFSFEGIKISTDTGDVSSKAPFAGAMTVATDTGDINIINICSEEHGGRIDIETDTGRVKLSRVNCKSLDIESDTGDVTLDDVVSSGDVLVESGTGDVTLSGVLSIGKLSIESDTGDVKFDKSDAAEIFVETDTGDVTGTLLSNKLFTVKTVTGDVDVPVSVAGGRCEITTATGDVELRIAELK